MSSEAKPKRKQKPDEYEYKFVYKHDEARVRRAYRILLESESEL